ncbi:MAG TPA: subclass B3 metallo-beta-lactamase [Vicinamibacterales bacterium]|nr:subclass B3 metallo-beta-lactamase [Vicinamibacterales bacterium]
MRALAFLLLTLVAFPALATPTPDNQPTEPFKIADGLFYVGASDVASYLVVTPAGAILIDSGYDDTVPLIRRSVERLGFDLRDIRILLNTQAHFDHAGGFAELKRLTGARLMVSEPDADVVEQGGRGDFLFAGRNLFPPARVDRRLRDGDRVELGGVTLTMHLTAGHTKGCTTWTFDAGDGPNRYHVVVTGGLSVLAGMDLRGMPAYPGIGRDFAHTFEVMRSLPCDIPLGAHASFFDEIDKAKRRGASAANPFVDPARYRTFVDQAERRFRETLDKQKGPGVGPAPQD